jgi:hypothetical protein
MKTDILTDFGNSQSFFGSRQKFDNVKGSVNGLHFIIRHQFTLFQYVKQRFIFINIITCFNGKVQRVAAKLSDKKHLF